MNRVSELRRCLNRALLAPSRAPLLPIGLAIGLAILGRAPSLAAQAEDPIQVRAATSAVSAQRVAGVAATARRGLKRLAPSFPGTPTATIRIVLHSSAQSITPALLHSLHEGVPGFARLRMNEIHLVLDRMQVDPPNDLRTTIDHELVHILLDQHVGEHGLLVPRWFHEGLAQDLAGGIYLGVREEDIVIRLQGRTHLKFRSLERGFPEDSRSDLALAYAQSFSFVAYLRRTIGLPLLLRAARECGPELGFSPTLSRLLNEGLGNHEDRWIEYVVSSGAGFRFAGRYCFSILVLLLAGPLLALAMARRRNREEALKSRMLSDDHRRFLEGEGGGEGEDDRFGDVHDFDRDEYHDEYRDEHGDEHGDQDHDEDHDEGSGPESAER